MTELTGVTVANHPPSWDDLQDDPSNADLTLEVPASPWDPERTPDLSDTPLSPIGPMGEVAAYGALSKGLRTRRQPVPAWLLLGFLIVPAILAFMSWR